MKDAIKKVTLEPIAVNVMNGRELAHVIDAYKTRENSRKDIHRIITRWIGADVVRLNAEVGGIASSRHLSG